MEQKLTKGNKRGHTHILKKSRTSGDIGDAPDSIIRTRPPRAAFTLLKTRRSQIGEGDFPAG